jgi:DNA-binding LytR/AlgR family response regulator
MRDAVGRLAGADGMQVHRSWWVARKAVSEARREGRDVILVLADGREAPVGRDRLRALQAGGWL